MRSSDVADLQVTSATSIDTASTNGSDISSSSSSNRLDYLKIHDLICCHPSMMVGLREGETAGPSSPVIRDLVQSTIEQVKAYVGIAIDRGVPGWVVVGAAVPTRTVAGQGCVDPIRSERAGETAHPVQQSRNRRRPHRQVRPSLPLQHHAQATVRTCGAGSPRPWWPNSSNSHNSMRRSLLWTASSPWNTRERELGLIRAGERLEHRQVVPAQCHHHVLHHHLYHHPSSSPPISPSQFILLL